MHKKTTMARHLRSHVAEKSYYSINNKHKYPTTLSVHSGKYHRK